MAETEYTYSVASDTANAKLDSDKLIIEIQKSSITIAIERIDVAGDVLDVVMKDAISGVEETTLDGVVSAHDGITMDPPPLEIFSDNDPSSIIDNNNSKKTLLDIIKVVTPGSTGLQMFKKGAHEHIDSGDSISIKSDNAADTLTTGVGAWKVMIHYVDEDGGLATETLSLNGTTAVNSVATNIKYVNRTHVVECHSDNDICVTTGKITIHEGTGGSGTELAEIAAGDSEEQALHYHLGTNEIMRIRGIAVFTEGEGSVHIRYSEKHMGTSIYHERFLFYAKGNTNFPANHLLDIAQNGKLEIWFNPTETGKLWTIVLDGWLEDVS